MILFSRFFDGYTSNTSIPLVNVAEEKDEYKIEVAAPGLSKKDFKVYINNSVLEISFEMKKEIEDENNNYVRREFKYSSFKRSFSLPNEVNTDKIKALHKDGVLKILIPKKEEIKNKGLREIKII